MSSGKRLQLLCIFPFSMFCLSAISMILSVYSPFSDRVGLPLHNTPFPGVLMKCMMFVKILLAVCILVGMVV